MSETSIDRITKALEKQGIDKEISAFKDAEASYRTAARLRGTQEKITLTDIDGESITVSTSVIFEQMRLQIVALRADRLKANATNEFLNKFNQFDEYLQFLNSSID